MATWFDITTTATDQTLPVDTRSGQQLYTVTNESGTLIRGDGLIVPDGETRAEWFTITQPSRVYSPDGSEQIPVAIKVLDDVAPGSYGYRLRMVVGDGIPEEQFNDGPASRITVQPVPLPPPPPPPPPPPKPFPWWIVVVVIVAVVVLGGVIFFVTTPKAPPDLVVTNVASSPFGDADVTIANNGDIAAPSFVLYLTYDFSGFLTSAFVGNLNGHETTAVHVTAGFYVGGTTGHVYLDPTNAVMESNESNNEFLFYP